MSLSRKYYRRIAEILRQADENLGYHDPDGAQITLDFIIDELVDLFKEDNSKFSEEKFRNAASYTGRLQCEDYKDYLWIE